MALEPVRGGRPRGCAVPTAAFTRDVFKVPSIRLAYIDATAHALESVDDLAAGLVGLLGVAGSLQRQPGIERHGVNLGLVAVLCEVGNGVEVAAGLAHDFAPAFEVTTLLRHVSMFFACRNSKTRMAIDLLRCFDVSMFLRAHTHGRAHMGTFDPIIETS